MSQQKKLIRDFFGFQDIRNVRRDFGLQGVPVERVWKILDRLRLDALRSKKRREVQERNEALVALGGIRRRRAERIIQDRVSQRRLSEGRTITLPVKDFRKTIDRLYTRGRYLITIGDNHYVLSDRTYERLRRYISPTGVIMEAEEYEFGSDETLIQQIIRVPTFSIQKFNEPERALPEGAFFPYTHKLEGIDFTDLQIFTENDYDIEMVNNENCFLTALRVAGVDIEGVKQMCKGRTLPKKKIKDVAEKFGLYITVKKLDERNLDKYGNKDDKHIPLGLIENHYFLIKEMPITSYAINNYETVCEFDEWWKITKVKNGKYPNREEKKYIDSFNVVKQLLLNKSELLDEIDRSILIETIYQDKLLEIKDISINKHNVLENKQTTKKSKGEYQNVFFDFETITKGERHEAYLCRCDVIKKTWVGDDCGRDMLNELVEKYEGKGLRLFAHNAGYDIRFIFKYLSRPSLIMRSRSLLRGNAYFKKTPIIIQDTYAHIPMPLSGFGKTFKLDVSKEIIPYSIYTRENVEKRYITIQECLEGVSLEHRKMSICKASNEKQLHDLFLDNCRKWNCIDDGIVDIITYSAMYCKMDCEVLEKGYTKFKGWMEQITGLDLDEYVSLPSVANDAMGDCYEGVYQLSGIPREFIQGAMVGGRTMCAYNEKKIVKDTLVADFDAVSLYPSAMKRLGGYLKGEPKQLNHKQLNYDFLKKCDGYFIDIQILKVGKHLPFPLMSKVNDDGVRMFRNDMEGEVITIDKISLEDLIEFQGVEFKIIRGYYYDEGRNNILKDKIQYFFDERKRQKANGNPIQNVYKLLMNSSYGKTLLKPFEIETKYLHKNEVNKFVNRYYNHIRDFHKLTSNKWMVNVYKPIEQHFNNVSCGVEVLSMSKRIMNEVMCLADDLGINVYYTDTDSTHIDTDKIDLLSEEYRKKYGRELIGGDMGQFHSDFDSGILKGKNINAKQSIFLGKKCYLDVLTDGESDDVDYHIRMKGCSQDSIYYWCEKNDKTLLDLYTCLYEGESVELDQTCDGLKIKFDYTKDFGVMTKPDFSRKICFVK